MTPEQAIATLKAGPLKFGDPAQIEAVKTLAADAPEEGDCDSWAIRKVV